MEIKADLSKMLSNHLSKDNAKIISAKVISSIIEESNKENENLHLEEKSLIFGSDGTNKAIRPRVHTIHNLKIKWGTMIAELVPFAFALTADPQLSKTVIILSVLYVLSIVYNVTKVELKEEHSMIVSAMISLSAYSRETDEEEILKEIEKTYPDDERKDVLFTTRQVILKFLYELESLHVVKKSGQKKWLLKQKVLKKNLPF